MPASAALSLHDVEIWTFFFEPFVLAVSCTVSWCCLVRKQIQFMRQFGGMENSHISTSSQTSDPGVNSGSGYYSCAPSRVRCRLAR